MARIPFQRLLTVTSNTTFSIPAGYMIRDVIVHSKNANAITGGVRIGTTDGGVDVVVALAVAGSSLAHIGTGLLKKIFSMASAQTLYIQAVVAWNSAEIDIYFDIIKVV